MCWRIRTSKIKLRSRAQNCLAYFESDFLCSQNRTKLGYLLIDLLIWITQEFHMFLSGFDDSKSISAYLHLLTAHWHVYIDQSESFSLIAAHFGVQSSTLRYFRVRSGGVTASPNAFHAIKSQKHEDNFVVGRRLHQMCANVNDDGWIWWLIRRDWWDFRSNYDSFVFVVCLFRIVFVLKRRSLHVCGTDWRLCALRSSTIRRRLRKQCQTSCENSFLFLSLVPSFGTWLCVDDASYPLSF